MMMMMKKKKMKRHFQRRNIKNIISTANYISERVMGYIIIINITKRKKSTNLFSMDLYQALAV